MDSPFDVLRIDPDADEEEVERAYRRRVLETHPDQGGSARELLRVRTAYEEIRKNGATEPVPDDPSDDGATTVDPDDVDPTTGDADRDADEGTVAEGDDDPDLTRVEFLDYQVLREHGWELNDEDLFEKAAAADLDESAYGRTVVEPGETLLEAAESSGNTWPYACRGGACSNCAVALVEGEMPRPTGHILPPEMMDRGMRLSCLAAPTSDEAKVVFNVKHLPGLDELRLQPSRFGGGQSTSD